MDRHKFTEEEIPYGILAKFGLTREMIGDLPLHILNRIYAGQKSPMLPVSVMDNEENEIRSKTRFSLIRKTDGSVDVVFYPKLIQSDLTRFSDNERQKLTGGKPVLGKMVMPDGRETQGFMQLDEGNGQILSVPTPVIGRNLQYMADMLHLSNAEVTCLRNGDPLTVAEEDEVMTIGIDLTEPTGIRICSGDEREWKDRRKQICEKYNFGCFGCWVMDEEGNLDYVHEEEYTEELWEEMKKNGTRRAMSSPKM